MDKENQVHNEEESSSSIDSSKIYKRKKRIVGGGLLALCLVLAIVLNVVFSALAYTGLWFIDMSKDRYKKNKDRLYTLSDTCKDLIASEMPEAVDRVNEQRAKEGKEPLKVNIIFCTDADYVENNQYLRYVQYTARGLEKAFPGYINVKYINESKNPSEVQKYKVNSASTIYSSNVIVEFGTEYIVHSWRNLFTANSESDAPWAYNGEKKLTASILSVTRAESPICVLTNNHGETIFNANGEIADDYTAFIRVIESSGYEVVSLDLEKDEIPKNCRMIISFNPQEDYKAFGNLGENNVSEIEKLDKYLDMGYSFFYICDRGTPTLKNLEEYLQEWGITVSRMEDAADNIENLSVKDTACVDDENNFIVGEYEQLGLGGSITDDMRSIPYPSKIIFGNSTAINPSSLYQKTYTAEDDTDEDTEYIVSYDYYKNGVSRKLFDIFKSTATAYVPGANGENYEVATSENRFHLFTITTESRTIQEGNYASVNDATYVLALASTDFLKNDVLDSSSYGNTDVLLSVLRSTSKEVIPVNFEFKSFYVYDMNDSIISLDVKSIAVYMIPGIAVVVTTIICGIVVCVRRKYK